MSNTEFDEVSPTSQDDRPGERERPRWIWWLAGTGITVLLLSVATAVSPSVRRQWDLSVFRQNTPYTQLAFNDAAALPTAVEQGRGISVSFAITNDEGKPESYQYVVASGSGSELKTLITSTETVSAGATLAVSNVVVPQCAKPDCRVQVSLPGQSETINFKFTYEDKSTAKK